MAIGDVLQTTAVYSATLIEMARADERIVALDADLMKASGALPFSQAFPERHFNVGIAEQNLLSVAAGLAAMGKIPFACAFSVFLVQRALDQAVNAVAYNDFNVKIIGSYAGLTQEKNGGTHMSVMEMAIMRALPRMVVLSPADGVELAASMRAAAAHAGPVFLRMPRGPLTTIFPDDYRFELGRAVTLAQGGDVTLVTTGITTWEGVQACRALAARGVSVRHLHLPTIKPIDRGAIIEAARDTGLLVTVEDQARAGGLGGAVAEIVCEECPVPVVRMGLDDRFGETAPLDYLLDLFGIDAAHIARGVEQALEKKGLARRA